VYGWSWCGNTVTFQIIGSDTGFIDVFIPLPAGIAFILSLNVIMTGAGVVGTSSIQRTFIIQSPSGDGITTGDETVLVPDTTPDTGGVYAYFPGGFGFRIEFFCSTPGTAILYGSITITTPIAS
jgi:hypothetical protein